MSLLVLFSKINVVLVLGYPPDSEWQAVGLPTNLSR